MASWKIHDNLVVYSWENQRTTVHGGFSIAMLDYEKVKVMYKQNIMSFFYVCIANMINIVQM